MSSSSIEKSRLIDLLWEICGGEATFFIDVSSPTKWATGAHEGGSKGGNSRCT